MAIADWIRESTARSRAKWIAQVKAEGFEEGWAEGFPIGKAEGLEQARAQAFRESYYQGYNDAVRDKTRKRWREHTGHCPVPLSTPSPPTVSNCRLAAAARARTAWRNSQ